MKFHLGDRFKVKENGLTGQIIKIQTVDFPYGKPTEEYVVLWDFLSKRGNYPVTETDAEDIWELTEPYRTSWQRAGSMIEVVIGKNPTTCSIHQWKMYTGFSESYEYCTNCDQKRSV